MDIGIIVWILIAASILFFAWISISAYGEHPYEWTLVCEIINLPPYYDCPQWYDGYFDGSGEMWVYVERPEWWFTNPEGISVRGFAVYGPYEELLTHKYSICNSYPELNQTVGNFSICGFKWFSASESAPSDGCYAGICIPVFIHEIKHLKCECDWHIDLEQSVDSTIWLNGTNVYWGLHK